MGIAKKTAEQKRYTKAEKIKILQWLEANDFSVVKTAKKYGVALSTIKLWRSQLANEAFGVKPRNDIAVQKKNEIELMAIANLKVETLKANASAKAAQIILERLSNPKMLKKISTDTLVKIAALYKEEAPVDAPKELDLLRQRMDQLYSKRQAIKDIATDTPYTDVEKK